MKMNISGLAVLVIVSIACFLGSYSFMYDLAYYDDGSQKYNLTTPDSTEGNMTGLFEEMNTTASELESTLTGSESWIQTAYNIFFRMPSTTISTLSTMANSAGKLLGIGMTDESKLPIPYWVITLILVIIGVVIAFTLVYLVFGRKI